MPNTERPSDIIQTKIPLSGLGGLEAEYTLVIAKDGALANPSEADGMPGEYEVIFTLFRPGYNLTSENEFKHCDQLSGSSHWQMLKSTAIATANTPDGVFEIECQLNDQGFLSGIAIRCQAENFQDAKSVCHRVVAPFLSSMAFIYEIPLSIYQTDTKELGTGSLQLTSRASFKEVKPYGRFNLLADPDFRPYASIYREAITTNSDSYAFLCYYRIIESIDSRRKRLLKPKGADRNGNWPMLGEIYPQSETEMVQFLSRIYPFQQFNVDDWVITETLIDEARGKAFKELKAFLKPIRDNIAHAFLQQSGELVLIDDVISQHGMKKWMGVTRCVARHLIMTDFPNILPSH